MSDPIPLHPASVAQETAAERAMRLQHAAKMAAADVVRDLVDITRKVQEQAEAISKIESAAPGVRERARQLRDQAKAAADGLDVLVGRA